MRIGILGGTFDPIHIAHLHAAETALSSGLDRLLLMPAGDPWQKSDRTVTGADHRVRMVELAIDDAVGFELDRREIERDGPTYTIDTLQSFGESDELSLIVGADAAAGFHTWHRYEEILGRANLLVVPRPGVDAVAAVDRVPGARLLEMAALDVSSTMIRRMAKDGRPFRYLVTERVHKYIKARNLYTNGRIDDMVGETSETETSS